MSKKSAKVEEATKVAVVWIPKHVEVDDNGDCEIAALTGYGGVRVYEKDKYDSRVDLCRDREKDGPIPFFEKFSQAFEYMGQQVQIPAWMGSKLFS